MSESTLVPSSIAKRSWGEVLREPTAAESMKKAKHFESPPPHFEPKPAVSIIQLRALMDHLVLRKDLGSEMALIGLAIGSRQIEIACICELERINDYTLLQTGTADKGGLPQDRSIPREKIEQISKPVFHVSANCVLEALAHVRSQIGFRFPAINMSMLGLPTQGPLRDIVM